LIRKIRVLFLILFICSNFVYPQWQAGVSYSIKSGIPENGLGITISRNLPFQWPLIGFMVRAEANLFSTNSDFSGERALTVKNLKQTDIHLNILATFYPRYLQPYAGAGFGLSSLIYETNDPDAEEFIYTKMRKNCFFIEGLAGFRLSSVRNFYPFIEVHTVRYFTSFRSINIDISSIQVCWRFGLNISFDTI